MSLRKYQAFVETVRLGSLTRAAQSLDSTQSRISHILADLEEEFGFPLLSRSRSGIQLTQAGKLLLPKMQAILHSPAWQSIGCRGLSGTSRHAIPGWS